MSAVKRPLLTEEEYILAERAAGSKSEYDRGHVYAMAGASRFHNSISVNLIAALHPLLRGTGCQTYASDMKVWSPRTRLFTYPDLVIVCGTPTFKDEHTDILLNPKVVIEILSHSTEKRDRTYKFKGYIALDSVQEYVLVSQDDPFIERIVRGVDGQWALTPFDGLDGDFAFATVPLRIPMRDIYANVVFNVTDDPNT